jgi:hypothetical protein
MCLTTITQGPNPTEEGEGWKVFANHLAGWRGFTKEHLRSPLNFFFFLPNQWAQDNCHETLKTEFQDHEYESGFHIFENKEDAQRYLESFANTSNKVVRKVKYRSVTAKGKNRPSVWSDCNGYFSPTVPCIVAREIFIEPEEEQKECA